MKKLLSILLTITVLFTLFTFQEVVYGNTSTDIIIKNFSYGSSTIRAGQEFTLTLTLENKSGETLKNVYIEVGRSSSFYPKNTGSRVAVNNGADMGSSDTATASVSLVYNGGGDTTLPITIIYRKGSDPTNEITITDYVGIKAIPTGNDNNIPPVVDTTPYAPQLTIENTKIPEATAGKSISIPLSIKNNSPYQARNVVITPEVLGDNNPFTIENLSSSIKLDRVDANNSTSTGLNFKVDPKAEAKIYGIKLNFKFTNNFGNTYESSEIIYVKVSNNSKPSNLLIQRMELKPQTVAPGKATQAIIVLNNNGDQSISDIKVSVEGLSGDGIVIDKGTNQQYIAKIDGNKLHYLFIDLKASSRAASGNYGLTLKFQYRDGQKQLQEQSHQFFVTVEGEETINRFANVVFQDLSAPQGSIKPNEDFNISFGLKNIGNGKADNIKVSVETDSVIIPKSQSVIKVANLEEGKIRTFNFKLAPTTDAQTRNYPIKINVEYEDEKGKTYTISQYVGVSVVNTKVEDPTQGESTTIPKLIIDYYHMEPTIVKAGENFDLNLSFFNTNRNIAVRNIKIFLTVDEKTEESGNVFTPVNSSNTFYIDYIAPKNRIEKSITLFTVPDAKAKTYTITANFEYEDHTGKEYRATELIGIPVVQQSRLEIGDLNIPSEAFVGQPFPVFTEFYNMGKVTLYNLMVKLEGDFHTENGSYFIGNFQSGSTEFFEGMIVPTTTGNIEGALVFTFDDSTGQQVEIRKELVFSVMEMVQEPFEEDMGFEPQPMEKSLFKRIITNKIFWGATSTLLMAAAGGFVWRRNKKKKGIDLDE